MSNFATQLGMEADDTKRMFAEVRAAYARDRGAGLVAAAFGEGAAGAVPSQSESAGAEGGTGRRPPQWQFWKRDAGA